MALLHTIRCALVVIGVYAAYVLLNSSGVDITSPFRTGRWDGSSTSDGSAVWMARAKTRDATNDGLLDLRRSANAIPAASEKDASGPVPTHIRTENKSQRNESTSEVEDTATEPTNGTASPSKGNSRGGVTVESNTTNNGPRDPARAATNEPTQNATNISKFAADVGPRPHFVLHVGPGKTGTTAIQKGVGSQEIKRWLDSDNYTVIPHAMIHRKGFLKSTNGTYAFPGPFQNFVETQKRRGPKRHIFGSSEYLGAPLSCASWRELLSADGIRVWDLHVVVVYRHGHEIVPSLWNQRYKRHRHPDGTIAHNRHVLWPEDGGTRVKPLRECLDEGEFLPAKGHAGVDHGAHHFVRAWKACADTVTVLSYHGDESNSGGGEDGHDLLGDMICNGMIAADHACSRIKSEKSAPAGNNPSENLDYEILAVHAHEAGWLPRDLERPVAVKLMQAFAKRYVQGDSSRAPIMMCPNPTVLDRIHDTSLDAYKWAVSAMGRNAEPLRTKSGDGILARPLTGEQRDSFERSWKETVDKKKFCNVDAGETLAQSHWKAFFVELARTPPTPSNKYHWNNQ